MVRRHRQSAPFSKVKNILSPHYAGHEFRPHQMVSQDSTSNSRKNFFFHEQKTHPLGFGSFLSRVIVFLRLFTTQKFIFQIVFNTHNQNKKNLPSPPIDTRAKDKILIFAPDLLFEQFLVKQKKNK
jgi:hypothetical protein